MGINVRKPVFGVSGHAWLNQTNMQSYSDKLKNAAFVRVASLSTTISREWTTKALIKLRRCACVFRMQS